MGGLKQTGEIGFIEIGQQMGMHIHQAWEDVFIGEVDQPGALWHGAANGFNLALVIDEDDFVLVPFAGGDVEVVAGF